MVVLRYVYINVNINHLLQTEITARQDVMSLSSAAVLLVLCVQHLHGSALPAVSSYEFTAYRMQQYNLARQKHVCKIVSQKSWGSSGSHLGLCVGHWSAVIFSYRCHLRPVSLLLCNHDHQL
ncbi:hypothetical protein ILYODFUR_026629 [Ilyodon furcidens]|uniref:Secreted protein n=1 Tax=Ilyodon furcidens TaxID=33524 RepID=A0ABV0VHV0_9TELE